MWTLFRIALRNVMRNRRRTLLTLSAIAIGISVTVLCSGLITGVKRSLVVNTVDSMTGAIQIHRAGYMKNVLSTPLTMDMQADDALLSRIRSVPGVVDVAPRIQFAGSVSVGDHESLFFSALALDPEAEKRVCPERYRSFSSDARWGEPDAVLLSGELADAVEAKTGTEAVLLAPDRDGALSAEVAHLGGRWLASFPGDAKVGVVPLALAQKLLHMEGRATEIAVRVDNVEHVPAIAAQLRTILGPEYEVHQWDEIALAIKQGMNRQDFVIFFVTVVFMVLMILGVANTMLMSALERTREIGTMMAVGVRRSKVLGLFLMEALAIGVAGSGLGMIIGWGITALIDLRGMTFTVPNATVALHVHPSAPVHFLIFLGVLSSVGAVLSALYPAWRASRLRPVEALAGQ